MPRTLLILIGGHLSTAPRPQKESAAAKASGFDIRIRGTWWDDQLAAEDLEIASELGVEYKPVVDLRQSSNRRGSHRIKQRLAREIYTRFGVVTSRSFGPGAPELLKEATRMRPDFTMVHSEAGLWVGKKLLSRGLSVGVDFEDWFSEDLPISERKSRPVRKIKELEHYLLKFAQLSLATTDAMGKEMAKEANAERVPLTIPNCFPMVDSFGGVNGDARSLNSVSFYWFSQTIGPGRGLETLARALLHLKGDWELHLRGKLHGYDRWFEEHFCASIRDRVHIHACVSNSDLPKHSASHDVGLALEIPHCPSRDLTATNKIFEYLRCGLAVIATSTRGQTEVMSTCPKVGWLVSPTDVDGLAKVMQSCINDDEKLLSAKKAARAAAENTWNWENYSSLLGFHIHTAAKC